VSLNGYRMVNVEDLARLDSRLRHAFQRAAERQAFLEAAARVLQRQLEHERTLLNIAVHDLALARGEKDPAYFVRRWNSEHRERRHWGDE
jgi:hypothetical protein